MKKRIQSVVLIVTLLFGLMTPATCVNAEAADANLLEKRGFKGITATAAIDDLAEEPSIDKISSVEIPLENREYWTQYASDYYYTYYLNDAEKKFWNDLEELCIAIATSTQDYSIQPYERYYLSEVKDRFIPCDASISLPRMIDLMFLFVYSNPQYYFLSNRIGYTYPGRNYGGILVVYDEFTTGAARKAATDAFCGRIDAWVADVEQQVRPEEKVKRAHDIICQNTVYNFNDYDQTAYSLVSLGETVCAGYAKTMQIMCNAVGVDCLMVTGDNHAWNTVQLHGTWYELDATWDDQDYGIIYSYYNRSRNTFHSEGGHTAEEPYSSMLVDAPYDMMSSERGDYVSPYFVVDNVTYFVVNDNTELASLLAKPIDATGSVPLTVTNNGKTYNVIGGSAEAGGSTDVSAQVLSFVQRMYTVALGRDAEEAGSKYWADQLLAGDNDGAGIARGFILSKEFMSKGYDDANYVKVLYKTFFNREPAAEEVSYWTGMLSAGNSREFVLAGFVNSNEFDVLCTSYGISRGFLRQNGTAINPGIGQFAERLYTKVLERAGEKEGIEYWTLQIADGVCTPVAAAKSFFTSPEYLNKKTSRVQYIEACYRTFMGREADADGVIYWKNYMNNGATREEVLTGFSNSGEFQQIMREYGL